MILNDNLGQVPRLPNPFVYDGHMPKPHQVWTQFSHGDDRNQAIYCRIIGVRGHYQEVTYEILADGKWIVKAFINVARLDDFKEHWIFSH